MTKYNTIPLKEHKSRVDHICKSCEKEIKSEEKVYYQSDRFLQSISNKKFCEECFNKYGQELLNKKQLMKDDAQKTLK